MHWSCTRLLFLFAFLAGFFACCPSALEAQLTNGNSGGGNGNSNSNNNGKSNSNASGNKSGDSSSSGNGGGNSNSNSASNSNSNSKDSSESKTSGELDESSLANSNPNPHFLTPILAVTKPQTQIMVVPANDKSSPLKISWTFATVTPPKTISLSFARKAALNQITTIVASMSSSTLKYEWVPQEGTPEARDYFLILSDATVTPENAGPESFQPVFSGFFSIFKLNTLNGIDNSAFSSSFRLIALSGASLVGLASLVYLATNL